MVDKVLINVPLSDLSAVWDRSSTNFINFLPLLVLRRVVFKLFVAIISCADVSFFLAVECAVQYPGFRRRGTRKGGVDVIDSALLHSLPHLRPAGRVSYAACRRTRMCSRLQGSILRLDLVSGNEEKKQKYPSRLPNSYNVTANFRSLCGIL